MFTLQSSQDFGTTCARIQAITLQNNLGWKYANDRTWYENNQQRFAHYLHQAMGYRADNQDGMV